MAARPSPESCPLLFLSRRHFPSRTLLGFNGRKGGFTAPKVSQKGAGSGKRLHPCPSACRNPQPCGNAGAWTGVPRHTKTAGSATGDGAGRGLPAGCHQCPNCHRQGSVLPQGITPAASPTDSAWARGRKWGSEAPPKPDCARPALGTRGSMGCKQPGEPLRRGVNKGISETVSELVPAGRRSRTIPTPAYNREQPSPHSLAGKAGDKGEGAPPGDGASLPGGQGGGHCEPQCRRWQWDRAGTAPKSHPGSSCTLSRGSGALAAEVGAFPAVPGPEPG